MSTRRKPTPSYLLHRQSGRARAVWTDQTGIIEPLGLTTTTTQSQTGFGDISITPRVLLHETKDFSLTSELAVTIPTGTRPLAGIPPP